MLIKKYVLFRHQKIIKKAHRFCMTFSSAPNKSVQKGVNPFFKINVPFSVAPSKNISTTRSGSKKMVNKNSLDYHPSSSGLTSRIHLLIFLLNSLELYLSPEHWFNFLANLYISSMVNGNFQI